jgi:hypothetical protein
LSAKIPIAKNRNIDKISLIVLYLPANEHSFPHSRQIANKKALSPYLFNADDNDASITSFFRDPLRTLRPRKVDQQGAEKDFLRIEQTHLPV